MIEPILHRVLIKPDPVETKTETGIILSLNEKREQAAAESGVVVRMGSTCFKDYGEDSSLLKEGDRVFYARYAGKQVKDTDGTEYVLLNDEDIVAIIKEEEK